jgi:hypothetical protein
MTYFEELKLLEVARGMSEEDSMVFLQVFLIEKGLYPKFIKSKRPDEISHIVNPEAMELIAYDKLDEIALKFGESVQCDRCPFKMSNECKGNDVLICKHCWSNWLRYTLYKV